LYDVEIGMKNGDKVIFREEANQQPGLEPGDVVVQLQCATHPMFTRKGKFISDLNIVLSLTYWHRYKPALQKANFLGAGPVW